jgi:hypothetical protein
VGRPASQDRRGDHLARRLTADAPAGPISDARQQSSTPRPARAIISADTFITFTSKIRLDPVDPGQLSEAPAAIAQAVTR